MVAAIRCWLFHQHHRRATFRDLDMNLCRVRCGKCKRGFVTTLTRFPKELQIAVRAAASDR